MESSVPGFIRRLVRAGLSVGIIAALALANFWVIHVNTTTVALTLLLAVLGIATRWGLLESLIASLAGMLCFNYFFLPPVGRWTIADPQNWVALFAFLVTAVVASHLSATVKRRAAEATARQREMERLYALSRSLMLMDAQSPSARQIAHHIAQVFQFQSVVLYDRAAEEIHRAGPVDAPWADGRLRDAALQGTVFTDVKENLTVLPISLGGKVSGSLALPSSPASETVLRAIAQLAAIVLERARAQEAASRAEAVRQSEELKSAMLDALAHEFKTPLTSVKAAVSSILDDGSTPPAHTELLRVVDEETDRLTSMVTEAIQVARIEAGQIELRKAPQSMAHLIRQSLAKLARTLESRPLEVHVSEDLPAVSADAELVGIVTRQLVDNAARYSPPDSPIAIRAVQQGDSVVVGVADRGPGLSESDRSRVFEKFYRGRAARERIPGTGMGLAIAREIIQAHHGDIWVESVPGQGSEFLFSLPIAREDAQA